jgi:hypothetical protein
MMVITEEFKQVLLPRLLVNSRKRKVFELFCRKKWKIFQDNPCNFRKVLVYFNKTQKYFFSS